MPVILRGRGACFLESGGETGVVYVQPFIAVQKLVDGP